MKSNKILTSIKNGLIVSCQARQGWPMYGTNIMVAFATAAKQGGAVGIRATEPQNIKAIKNEVSLPIIGIYKKWYDKFDVYITPTFESAKAVIEAGADIVALDGTPRKRPGGETLKKIISDIHKQFPDQLVMADCDSLENGQYAKECGADIVSTTLFGYTKETEGLYYLNLDLIYNMNKKLGIPVIAEGHITNGIDVVNAYKSGAFSVVVGSAITRPEFITRQFVKAIASYKSIQNQ